MGASRFSIFEILMPVCRDSCAITVRWAASSPNLALVFEQVLGRSSRPGAIPRPEL